MDLRHLETFVTIVERKSFTKAAERLFLTQPTVSKQIVDLERYFGIKLLDRTKRYVVLTKAGEIVFRYARDFLELKKELISTIDAFKGLKQGSIVIGASNIPGIYVLPSLLNRYKKKYPGVQVTLSVSDTKETMGKMEEGLIDIGFVGARVGGKDLEYRNLLSDTLVIVGSPEWPDVISLENLGSLPFVMRELGSGTRTVFEKSVSQATRRLPVQLNITAECSDTEAIKHSVRNGLGIACISRMAIGDDLTQGNLKVITVTGLPEIRRYFYMITKKGKTLLPQVTAFIEIVDGWRKDEKK